MHEVSRAVWITVRQYLVVFSLCHKISRWYNEIGRDSDLSFMEFLNYNLIQYNKLYMNYTPAAIYQRYKRLGKPWKVTKEWAKLNSVGLNIKLEFGSVTGSNRYNNSFQLKRSSNYVSFQDISICACVLSFESHYPLHCNS